MHSIKRVADLFMLKTPGADHRKQPRMPKPAAKACAYTAQSAVSVGHARDKQLVVLAKCAWQSCPT